MPNSYWVTKPDHRLQLTREIMGEFTLGRGVDLSDPEDPLVRNINPFLGAEGVQVQTLIDPVVEKSSVYNSSQFIQNTNEYEEAQTLNAYFKGNFGASFQAALSYARKSINIEQTVYVIIESIGDDVSLKAPDLNWATAPNSESAEIIDEADRLRQFIETYGSHYVSSIRCAYRIALRGALQSTSNAEGTKFSAAFSGWGTSAGVDAEATKTLKTMNVQYTAVLTCGSISPANYANRWIIRSFDDITDFLVKLRNDDIEITRAPITVALTSFRKTLLGFPKTRAALSVVAGQAPLASFGVPKGTILPWWPSSEDMIEVIGPGGELQRTINAPDGWAICDGSIPKTPSLLGQFLRGAKIPGETGGSADAQQANTLPVNGDLPTYPYVDEGGDGRLPGMNHTHHFSFTSIPPYTCVVYIIKL